MSSKPFFNSHHRKTIAGGMSTVALVILCWILSACVAYWSAPLDYFHYGMPEIRNCERVVPSFVSALRNREVRIAQALVVPSQRQKVADWIEINPNRTCRMSRFNWAWTQPVFQGYYGPQTQHGRHFRFNTGCNGTGLNVVGFTNLDTDGRCVIQSWGIADW
jgi:hypothetical protein